MESEYHLTDKVTIDGDIPVEIYTHKTTGLTIVVASVESPIVKGDFCLATEAFDDDGLPHTLEHLIYMGSEDYPYKGVLDLLATRCLASDTNAYTDIDHTNYKLETAGSDGFLKLLPVYLDHILFPILTDAAYLTEVHHINEAGENAGVVYCEMQGSENSGDSRCEQELLKLLYPGKCGYKSQTGGKLENLRNSTSNDKVRNYHKEFYHVKNLCLIITGSVKPEEVFKAVEPITNKFLAKKLHLNKTTKPWQTPVEPLPESVTKTIQYSSDTDSDGLVYIGWRGPNITKDYKDLVALAIILEYLDSTAIGPLQKHFVESEEPFCSSVYHSITENSTTIFEIVFESVGKEFLHLCCDKLFEILRLIYDGKEALDLKHLKAIISRRIVRTLSAAETSPHSLVAGAIIGNFLYGANNLHERCHEISLLEELIKFDKNYWLDLLDKYFIGPNSRYACIVGEPSPEFMKKSADAEQERIEKQKEELKEKIEEIAASLQNAQDTNNIPPPKELIQSFSVPSIDNIKFHSIERVVLDPSKGPFRLQYDSIKTNFITIHCVMDTSSLTKEERLYLPLLTDLLLESPIMRDNKLIDHETVVAELFADTITYALSTGFHSSSSYATGTFSMLMLLAMQIEPSKYSEAVGWYKSLLYDTVFTNERIKTLATRMVGDIEQLKRSGGKVASCLLREASYQSNSNQWACNFLRQQQFLKRILKNLKAKDNEVVKSLTNIRNKLTLPARTFVHLTLDKSKVDVDKIHEPWDEKLNEIFKDSPKKYLDISTLHDVDGEVEFSEDIISSIVSIGSIESNYMQQCIKTKINSINHPDLAPLYVLIQSLIQIEGPMWRQIRGLGLSYHYDIHINPYAGLLIFELYKSSQLVAAYKKAVEIVKEYVEVNENLQETMIESAKSSLIFEFIKKEKNPAGKSVQSLVAYIKNLDVDYNKDIIRRILEVKREDIQRVGRVYLSQLFEGPIKEQRSVVVCHNSKTGDILDEFKHLGKNLESLNLNNIV